MKGIIVLTSYCYIYIPGLHTYHLCYDPMLQLCSLSYSYIFCNLHILYEYNWSKAVISKHITCCMMHRSLFITQWMHMVYVGNIPCSYVIPSYKIMIAPLPEYWSKFKSIQLNLQQVAHF